MSPERTERLYRLLPEVYRVRDAEEGYPLRALLGVIESEAQRVESDILGLYENWFIETCADWVIPYIGDLLGVRGVPASSADFSPRAFVANTLAYRRRKGTAAVLEQLAHDLLGRPVRAVEFFERLAATQHVNHVRPGRGGTANLHNATSLELIGGPFDPAAHTVEVRSIATGRGRWNLPSVGLFVWSLRSYPVTRSSARAVAEPNDGRFTFNPLGLDAPLFNRPRTERDIADLATEANAPGRLRARALRDELHHVQQGGPADEDTTDYFDDPPVLQVHVRAVEQGPWEAKASPSLRICDLSDWRRPTAHDAVAVDPARGRLAFAAGATPAAVEVSYSCGFGGDLGGGPYDRRASVAKWLDPTDPDAAATFQIGVARRADVPLGADPDEVVETLLEAVARWNQHAAQKPGAFGVIAIMDSRTYREDLQLTVPAGAKLAVVAADWPLIGEAGAAPRRIRGQLIPEGRRPHLRGAVRLRGGALAGGVRRAEAILDGILIEGEIRVQAGDLGRLRLLHSTLVPGQGGLVVETGDGTQNAELCLDMERCISGSLRAESMLGKTTVADSLVDAAGAEAIRALDLHVYGSTVFGTVATDVLHASNAIFMGTVVASRRQSGCVRFSYVSLVSLVPRRHRCQPSAPELADRVRPQFSSTHFGHPAYGLLSATCPDDIVRGADDEGEMGAFHFLQLPGRLDHLRQRLDEYLPFGLEAGILFAT